MLVKIKNVRVNFPHCGNYGIFLSPRNISSNQLFSNIFSITVTFTKFLPKMREKEIPIISTLCFLNTMWKLWNFSLTLFRQKFRESNGFTKQITKELI